MSEVEVLVSQNQVSLIGRKLPRTKSQVLVAVIGMALAVSGSSCKRAYHQVKSLNQQSLSSSQGSLSTTELDLLDKFERAQAVLQAQCILCHNNQGDTGHPFELPNNNAFIQAGLIVPGQPDQSILIRRLKNYPLETTEIKNMPMGSNITESDYQILVDWIKSQ